MPQLTSDATLARVALSGGLAAGVAVFAASVIGGLRSGEVFGSLATGVFLGLLVACGGAFGAMLLARTPPPPAENARGQALADDLAPILAELEATRLDFVAQAERLATLRVPFGIACGAGLWLWSQWGDEPRGTLELIVHVGIGAALGYVWATAALGSRYARLYKERVLTSLAARFGALGYRAAVMPDVSTLVEAGVLPGHTDASADDELTGTYRGMALSIVELELHSGTGKRRRQVFGGLIVGLDLPRALSGDTAIVHDSGFGGIGGWLSGRGADRVRLEDPSFEAEFEVYGTDQIGARALLTPAFIERFMAFAERPGFGKPAALAQGNHQLMALPRHGGGLFEPPGFRQPAASRAALVELYDDIAAVLATADAVIDLDHAARGVAARSG